ncbi:MAG: hypothetical protein CL912_28415 [Deltaproteobacteria bacterium]|nr:hypothetical protein [Deltaproteobacteria bacterium]
MRWVLVVRPKEKNKRDSNQKRLPRHQVRCDKRDGCLNEQDLRNIINSAWEELFVSLFLNTMLNQDIKKLRRVM